MRVYLPCTIPSLRGVLDAGEVGPAPLSAHAVTPALREWYAEGDLEELEYAAMGEAAEASLRLLADDAGASPRRIVIAADVPDHSVAPDDTTGRAGVRLLDPVPWSAVVSVHADDDDAEADVRAAVQAVAAADGGDDGAQFVVDGAQGHELLWFASQEAPELLR